MAISGYWESEKLLFRDVSERLLCSIDGLTSKHIQTALSDSVNAKETKEREHMK